jgi:hypothetical protein
MTQPNTGKYFPTYFLLHYQISENTFLKFTFSRIHFLKKIIFQQINKQILISVAIWGVSMD